MLLLLVWESFIFGKKLKSRMCGLFVRKKAYRIPLVENEKDTVIGWAWSGVSRVKSLM